MRTLLRPLALTVAALFAAVPVTALACQWVCATPAPLAAASIAAPAAHGHAHHGSLAPADASSRPAHGTAAVHASDLGCDHTGAVEPAIARNSVKVLASLPIPVPYAELAQLEQRAVPVSYVVHSPPGGRSAPLALRI